jgi:hypothetical protein
LQLAELPADDRWMPALYAAAWAALSVAAQPNLSPAWVHLPADIGKDV